MNRTMDQVLAKYTAFKKKRKLSKATLENDEKGLVQISQIPVKLRFTEKERSHQETIRKALVGKQFSQLTLSHEQEKELLSNFEIVMSPQKLKIESEMRKQLVKYLDERESLLNAAEENRSFMSALWKQNLKCGTAIQKQKLSIANIVKTSFDPLKLQKRIYNLEDKLGNTNQAFSLIMQSNAQRRKEIEVLLRGKKRFNELFMEILNELEDGEEHLEYLVNESTAQFESREFAQKKLVGLLQRCEYDAAFYQMTIVNRRRQLRDMTLLRDFMNMKMMERLSVEDKVSIELQRLKGGITEEMKERESRMKVLAESLAVWKFRGVKELSEKLGNIKGDFHNLSKAIYNIAVQIMGLDIRSKALNKAKEELEVAVKTRNDEYNHFLTGTRRDLEALKAYTERLRTLLEFYNNRFQKIIEPINSLVESTGCDISSMKLKIGAGDNITVDNILGYVNLLNYHVANLVKVNDYTLLLPIRAESGQRKFEECIRDMNRNRIMEEIARMKMETRREDKKNKEKDKMKEKHLRNLRQIRRKRTRRLTVLAARRRSENEPKKVISLSEYEYEDELEEEEENGNYEDENKNYHDPLDDASSDDNPEEEENYQSMHAADIKNLRQAYEFVSESELCLIQYSLPIAPKVVEAPGTRSRMPGRTQKPSTLQKRAMKEAIRRNPFIKSYEDLRADILEKPLNIKYQSAFGTVDQE